MAAKKTFLVHQGVNVEGMRSLSLIFNQMLICSACPLSKKTQAEVGISLCLFLCEN
jgi:hypothetical protein